jgi:hypothetical protein
MSKKKEIKKPWCVYLLYSHSNPMGVGKIEEEGKTFVSLRLSEGQRFSLIDWDKKKVWRFATITAAIKKFNKHDRYPIVLFKNYMLKAFPSKSKAIKRIKHKK